MVIVITSLHAVRRLCSATRPQAKSRPRSGSNYQEERDMSGDDVSVVLAHGAWADGSSWSKVIVALQQKGVTTIAAPLPLTSLSDDVLALDRTSERVEGQLVLVGHAYAGAVIGSTRNQRVKSLVYVAGLAPAEGETVADVFYRGTAPPAGAEAGTR